jgi:hypothetical protein
VSGAAATWTAGVEAPAGFTATVDQPVLELAAGESATFTVTVTRTTAAMDTWSFGSLTWTGSGGHEVRSPIALRADALAAPDELTGTGVAGSGEITVNFGYDGPYTADASGLIAATETPGTVVDDPANDINTALATGVGITEHTIAVPAGTALARFALFDDETDGTDDLDLYIFGPDGALVGSSGSGTSQERVDLTQPAAGNYTAVVHGWQTDGPDANYTLFSWAVPTDDGDGSLDVTAAPTTAVSGTSGTVAFAWSGLAAGARHLGLITHTGPDGPLGQTVLSVDT